MNRPKAWLPVLGAAMALALLGLLLWRVHPLAPWLLLLTLAIQLPIIWLVGRKRLNGGYRQRAAGRRIAWLQTCDAEAWLAAEENEKGSTGWGYWSKGARALNALARAEALLALGRRDDAAAALAEAEGYTIDKADMPRYEDLLAQMLAGAPGPVNPPAKTLP